MRLRPLLVDFWLKSLLYCTSRCDTEPHSAYFTTSLWCPPNFLVDVSLYCDTNTIRLWVSNNANMFQKLSHPYQSSRTDTNKWIDNQVCGLKKFQMRLGTCTAEKAVIENGSIGSSSEFHLVSCQGQGITRGFPRSTYYFHPIRFLKSNDILSKPNSHHRTQEQHNSSP